MGWGASFCEDVPLVESKDLVFTCTPGESYRRRLGSLLFRSRDVFRALINSLCRRKYIYNYMKHTSVQKASLPYNNKKIRCVCGVGVGVGGGREGKRRKERKKEKACLAVSSSVNALYKGAAREGDRSLQCSE